MSLLSRNTAAVRSLLGTSLAILLGGPGVSCSSSTGPLLTRWEAHLLPVFPATVEGQAAAVTQFGRTEASVQIGEAEPETEYGWRINAGTCEEEGEMQGGLASYPPMTPGPGGTATSDAVLAEVFRAKDSFAVRVFLQESGTVVSCGELALFE